MARSKTSAPNRNIVYNATVEVVVEGFSKISQDVIKLVKRHGAYVVHSTLSGSTGDNRRGTWRIRNKTKEEERLRKPLEDRADELEDVIAVERELSRVREELERTQGRMRVLDDLTSLTTVELIVNEIQNYVPAESPTFATHIRRAMTSSFGQLRTTGESAVVAAAAMLPSLAVLSIGLFVLGFTSTFGVRVVQRRRSVA